MSVGSYSANRSVSVRQTSSWCANSRISRNATCNTKRAAWCCVTLGHISSWPREAIERCADGDIFAAHVSFEVLDAELDDDRATITTKVDGAPTGWLQSSRMRAITWRPPSTYSPEWPACCRRPSGCRARAYVRCTPCRPPRRSTGQCARSAPPRRFSKIP